MIKGFDLLHNPFLNKGTAFTQEEREKYNLVGILPSRVKTIEQQVSEVYDLYKMKGSRLEKRHFLMEIFNHNRTLFFNLFSHHIAEMMPIVYDPVISESIKKYNERYIQPQGSAYLSIDSPSEIRQSLLNAADGRDIRLIVVTDSEGILGIGDWGVNGVDIAVGKLMVYTAAAGIDPAQVLPVVLDAGTNNQQLLDDPNYLGLRHKRIKDQRYFDFVDKFVNEVEDLFPKCLLHFEDFGRDTAAPILDKYRYKFLTFNDDIQGTGVIVLAGVLGALKISKQKITDQTFLTFGAGSAGTGIAQMLFKEMVRQGLSPEEAKKHFYLVDRQGLLFEDTPNLTPKQSEFARKRSEFTNSEKLTDLVSIIKAVQPTVMVGTSTAHGAFTEEAIREMAKHASRPIIFPISNPTEKIEAMPEDLLNWTDSRALVATGIPVDPVEYNGVQYEIGQANNALIYPAVGCGALAVQARIINDEMLSAAAHALSDLVETEKPGSAVLPPINDLPEFSKKVAVAVAQSAIDQGLAQKDVNAEDAVLNYIWKAEYKSLN